MNWKLNTTPEFLGDEVRRREYVLSHLGGKTREAVTSGEASRSLVEYANKYEKSPSDVVAKAEGIFAFLRWNWYNPYLGTRADAMRKMVREINAEDTFYDCGKEEDVKRLTNMIETNCINAGLDFHMMKVFLLKSFYVDEEWLAPVEEAMHDPEVSWESMKTTAIGIARMLECGRNMNGA